MRIREQFRGISPDEFSPISTWFSYGSNLFRQDFERKMKENGSYLSLVRARPARLIGWKRRLDNISSTRGLAYSVSSGPQTSVVDGIVHDVPIGDLPAFLRFEGVLDRNYQLKGDRGKNRRRYDIGKATAQLVAGDGSQDCFVLVGLCPVADESERRLRAKDHANDLIDYLRVAIKGAIDFDIDASPLQEDLKWAKDFA